MKKLAKVIISLFTMTMLMTSIASAATGSDITTALKEAGFGDYATIASDYLQNHEITSEQGDKIIAYIKEAKSLLNGKTFSASDVDTKAKLKDKAKECAAVIGLTISVNNGTVSVLDASGKALVKLTGDEIADVVSKLNFDKLAKAVDTVVAFHKSGDKKFEANGGTMKKTATNFGNSIVLGAGLIALAGVSFFGLKKKAVEA
ncbi:MAG: hypothetical protein SOY42_02340 [Clostridium sp.]|nr:hypothetical protein [Clostridium sp.]